MATKLYFSSTNSSQVNLPTTEQSTLGTPTRNADALTVNRTLSETKGAAQASLSVSTPATTSLIICYFSRFVSDPLDMTSIPSQTWTYNFASSTGNLNANFPVNGSNKPVYVNCYIWRPSTTSVVGTVLDGDSASVYNEPTTTTEKVMHGTFSGAAVSSLTTGDVLIFEVWFNIIQSSSNGRLDVWYYNGTTENTTDQAAVSNHASFISSPQTLTFDIPGTMTPNAVVRVHPKPIKVV